MKTEFWKILTENITILEQQNNEQKLQILEALRIRKKLPKLNRINFKSSTNAFNCCSYSKNQFKYKRYNKKPV